MSKYEKSAALSELTLGKETQYSSEYNPDLLQAVPRSLNRDDLSLTDTTLPFVGEDVWYGYELSWLNTNGKPVVAVAEFRFPCTSPNLVESKSFKLYLNSFNQSRFSSMEQVQKILAADLSHTAGEQASVALFSVDDCPNLAINQASSSLICIDNEDISMDEYQYNAQWLTNIQASHEANDQPSINETLVSHLLKSNCLITNQPDWASVYISYQGAPLNHAQLLKYLISFRQHNEFHEQCIERIFCDLQKYAKLEQLTVFARYTRRGGLDINPFRSTHLTSAPANRTLRQ
ncbi:NADPH-dependent 7-cyano-7-deazaguanine reductase QueF [Colwellia sp. D2M02]|uniref:NADPH-dependent 7-cyano-7-deazaguanine reductase QueF n=1 Tax=Colwellia sp. D2M02 TaxID=2841562 RepID=UPI001C08F8FD|nr:NADPH-dependent 7-cyano-7-deazaguanine reductase QueF [Colwellia sp. D2M02]MBU2893964.1 NADPH-dependent 7-cyano-7-deazaguanine reductase QueF [Colwellia sp. D2M02]